jgi:protein TonB
MNDRCGVFCLSRVRRRSARLRKLLVGALSVIGVALTLVGCVAVQVQPTAEDTRKLEAQRLREMLAESYEKFRTVPRRTFVGATVREPRLARYLTEWAAHLEHVGNLNYPQEARRQQLHGTLVLTVAVRADGSLESVVLNRSSGSDVLDQAALRIVELAAPFAALPPEITKDTDILEITRTWSFAVRAQIQEPSRP